MVRIGDWIWQDLKYSLRRWGSNPGFLLSAVLSLALGIGANTAIFQLLNAVRLRSLPVRAPDELAEIRIAGEIIFGVTNGRPISFPVWKEIRDRQEAFSSVFAWGFDELPVGTGKAMRKTRVA